MPGDRPRARPSLRRDALPDPSSVGEDRELADRLRAEIAEHGPITFARFMERALYEPGHGYYRRPDPGPGRGGDFLTAPELHPVFGAAIGRLVEQAWEAMDRPVPFTVSEPGAGSGALAAGLLTGLRDLGSPLLDALRYRAVEIEPSRLDAIASRLADDDLASHLVIGEAPRSPVEVGVVIANEVLDALPVHRLIGLGGGVRELLVGVVNDRFVDVEAAPSTPALARHLADEGVTLADGQVTEVCLVLEAWLVGAVRHLERGLLVIVDYADEPAALRSPSRPGGTLRTFARHAVGGDPYRHVGRQDITATVDLAAVRSAASRAGLRPLGETTQAELLAAVGDGLADVYLRRPGASLQDALLLRSTLARLMDTRGMGAFRVLAFGRALPGVTHLPGLRRAAHEGR